MKEEQTLDQTHNMDQPARSFTPKKGLRLAVKTNITLLTVVAIGLLGFAYQANTSFIGSFRNVLLEIAYIQAKKQSAEVARQIDYLYTELARFEKETPIRNLLNQKTPNTQANAHLESVVKSYPFYLRGLYLVKSDGSIIASSRSFSPNEKFLINQEGKYSADFLFGDKKIIVDKAKTFGLACKFTNTKEEAYLAMLVDLSIFANNKASAHQKKKVSRYMDTFIVDSKNTKVMVEPQDPSILDESALENSISPSSQDSLSIQTKEGSLLQGEKIQGTHWYFFVVICSQLYMNEAHEAQIKLLIASVIIILFLYIVISVFIRLLFTNRIMDLVTIIGLLSEGNLNIKFKNKINGDELGIAFQQLQFYISSLRNNVSQVLRLCYNATESGDQLGEEFNHFLKSMQVITDQVNETRNKMDKQNEYVNDTSAVVEQLAQNISSLDLSIEKQSSSVEESSSAIEEMIGSIQSINRITENARESVATLKETSDAGKKNQQEVITQISEIARNSEQLQEANTLIASIASQTNLLSMNAAIEASHAGDAGKGFAVVAEEIRDLAEQVASQSESVAKTINEIMQSIERTVCIADEAGSSFENILEKVHSVYQIMEEIGITMREQSNGSKEILVALGSMRDITYEVKTGSSEMSQGNKQILTAVEGLRDTSQEVFSNADQINEILNTITQLGEKISDLRKKNQENVRNVLRLTKEFRL